MIVSERIFRTLKKKGITQKQFSEMTGISQSIISDWKRKGTNPSSDKIMVICDALQVSPYDILTDEESASKGYFLHKESEAANLLERYEMLSEKKKQRLQGYLRALEEED